MKKIRLLRVFLFVKDLENTRDYEIESANEIKIRGVLEEKGKKVKITLFGKLEVPEDSESYKPCVRKNKEAPRKHLCFLGAEFVFRNIGRQPALRAESEGLCPK